MAWTTDNPVSVGNPTKKKDFDKLWDNAVYLRTNVISSGTVMLFAQNAPPTGWTRKTGWTPGAGGYTNIVYSSGAHSTGGATPATTDLVFTQAAHNHQWWNHIGPNDNDESYNSGGTSTDIEVATAGGGRHIDLTAATTVLGADYYTNQQTPAITKTTAFRYIAVIAATKDKYVP